MYSISKKHIVGKQTITKDISLVSLSNFFSHLKSVASGAVTSMLPGVGAAQAAVIAQGLTKFKKLEDFLVVLGGINTASVLLTLSVLYILGKTRTGIMSAVNQIIVLDQRAFLVLLAASFIGVAFGVFFSLVVGEFAARNITRISYSTISAGVVLLVLGLVFFFSSWMGLLVASVASAIGLLAPLLGVRRIHAMGCLIVPVVVYFI